MLRVFPYHSTYRGDLDVSIWRPRGFMNVYTNAGHISYLFLQQELAFPFLYPGKEIAYRKMISRSSLSATKLSAPAGRRCKFSNSVLMDPSPRLHPCADFVAKCNAVRLAVNGGFQMHPLQHSAVGLRTCGTAMSLHCVQAGKGVHLLGSFGCGREFHVPNHKDSSHRKVHALLRAESSQGPVRAGMGAQLQPE